MIRTLVAVPVVALLALLAGCAEKATDTEIDKMCDRLLELRGKPGDAAMKEQCVREARTEGVLKRRALCRIHAVNTQEYWNRCRTGEPRPHAQTQP